MANTDETMSNDLPSGIVEETEKNSSLRFPVQTKDDITTIAHY